MKKAIATIKFEEGPMTIYYNGSGENLTIESADENIDENIILGLKPTSVEDALKELKKLYENACWLDDILEFPHWEVEFIELSL